MRNRNKELTVFGLRAMGAAATLAVVKQVPAQGEIETVVAAGINLNGHLCAEVTDIRGLKVKGAYEVTCIAYRGGNAKKSYLIEALKGTAAEM